MKITLDKVSTIANHGVNLLTALATVVAVMQAVKGGQGTAKP